MALTTIHIIGQFAKTIPLPMASNACKTGISQPAIAMMILFNRINLQKRRGMSYYNIPYHKSA